ncbi:Zinc carboxypeptidase [Reichenbachiella agariperforans]|uniref:Zinc carboxypeptidase n=2 Tax=Reichenbachiella agariperforans TaxID=156994 RepID=A0A1M6LHU6_REIAG|nr:Zinc carboxypeptidase [Reichenbachiella agariperforans]
MGQGILPPVMPWTGMSELLIADEDDPWISYCEQSGMTETPSYQETVAWLSRLMDNGSLLHLTTIGESEQQRDIVMVIASSEENFTVQGLKNSNKPLLLVQAGIHAGEIDGKDAGLMLLRDIAVGGKEKLLDKVNLLFVPILNTDGHERISPYNRVNQRGPKNMGWRTNAQNLNLNRDYSKLETAGVQAIVQVINEYEPDLYLDLHVTDGADYQFDITYGWPGDAGHSQYSSLWLDRVFKPAVDKALTANGHVPGPLMFAFNDRDFSEGNAEYEFSPRFSDAYGDLRHVPSILVENHSLKPYNQRVLGTYVLLEQTIKILAKEGKQLRKAKEMDQASRPDSVVLSYSLSESLADSMLLKGIKSEMKPSSITDGEYIAWTGTPYEEEIVVRRMNEPNKVVSMPKAYWVPAEWAVIIDKLKAHGVKVDIITKPEVQQVQQYTIEEFSMNAMPFEGHVRCGDFELGKTTRLVTYAPGSARISTDQPLGRLVALLLEPDSPDSFLQWGYFHSIFSRTEYIEEYVIEPLAEQMLAKDAKLKERFESKKATDSVFAQSPRAIYEWFYQQSPYYDKQWKVYPVTRELN